MRARLKIEVGQDIYRSIVIDTGRKHPNGRPLEITLKLPGHEYHQVLRTIGPNADSAGPEMQEFLQELVNQFNTSVDPE